MFILWGKNAIQAYVALTDPVLVRQLMDKHPGQVYFHLISGAIPSMTPTRNYAATSWGLTAWKKSPPHRSRVTITACTGCIPRAGTEETCDNAAQPFRVAKKRAGLRPCSTLHYITSHASGISGTCPHEPKRLYLSALPGPVKCHDQAHHNSTAAMPRNILKRTGLSSRRIVPFTCSMCRMLSAS